MGNLRGYGRSRWLLGLEMPRFKSQIDSYDFIIVEKIREETHWCQIVGNTIVRCDHKAKDTGAGLWATEVTTSRGRSSWIGVYFGSGDLDQSAWFREDHVHEYISEKDVS